MVAVMISQIEKHGGMPTEGVLVNGDSGNDVELFAVPGVKGTMVANAHPELREWCNAHASDNIFQVTCRRQGHSRGHMSVGALQNPACPGFS